MLMGGDAVSFFVLLTDCCKPVAAAERVAVLMKKNVFYFVLLAVACVLSAALRTLEILFGIDADTGMYSIGSNWHVVFNIVAVISVVLLLSAFIFIKKEKKSLRRPLTALSAPQRILFMVFSAAALVDVIGNVFIKFASAGYSLSGSVDVFDILLLVFAVLLSSFFVAYASAPRLFGSSTSFKILSVSVSGFYIVRLFETFLDESIISHAYKTYSILFTGFVILFFINFSKGLSGMHARKGMQAFGLCSVYLGVIRAVDCVFSFVPGYNIPGRVTAHVCDVICTVAIFVLMLKCFRRRRPSVSQTAEVGSVIYERPGA